MRITFSIIAFILFLTLPYWVYAPFILIGVVIFPLYVEAIIFGLLIDTIYGGAGYGQILFGLPFSIGASLSVFLAVPLRESLRFNT